MNLYWLYDLPNWLFGIMTVSVFLAFGLVGLVLTRRWVPALHHEDHSYNDIVGFYLGALTVFYGITLGLLMVGVWANFSETEGKVDREAAIDAAFYRDVSSYPEPLREQLQNDLRMYTRNVIDVGWPQQRKGIAPTGNLVTLENLQRHLMSFEPATEGQKILHAEVFRQFNQLVEQRRSRLVSVSSGLSASLWTLVLVGAMINIAGTWFFHLRKKQMHIFMTALISSLLGLMIFLLAAMDHPFRGNLSVGPEPFEVVYDQLMRNGFTP
jgi:uncharacterized membrane protein YiaA